MNIRLPVVAHSWPLCVEMTSPVKPEVRNILQRRHRRSDAREIGKGWIRSDFSEVCFSAIRSCLQRRCLFFEITQRQSGDSRRDYPLRLSSVSVAVNELGEGVNGVLPSEAEEPLAGVRFLGSRRQQAPCKVFHRDLAQRFFCTYSARLLWVSSCRSPSICQQGVAPTPSRREITQAGEWGYQL